MPYLRRPGSSAGTEIGNQSQHRLELAPEGRVCETKGCEVQLSRYNRTMVCSACTPDR